MNQPLAALASPDPSHTKAHSWHTQSELVHILGTLSILNVYHSYLSPGCSWLYNLGNYRYMLSRNL
jgi:hypothetical protein